MKNDPIQVLQVIAQAIYDKKGTNILALDVREVSNITDYVVIAEGNVDRHVQAIAKGVVEALELIGEKSSNVEGVQLGDWVVLDYLDIMVHLFMPGLRDKYRLEELWNQGKIIDLNIVTTAVESTGYERSRSK
jgi:ribosome-associated protein